MQYPEKAAFIVGAPRCGTTTLSRLLRQHPKICFSQVKEPHFFSRLDASDMDESALRDIVRRNYLERFFGDCSGEILMEGSPTYLYTPERMDAILKLWPEAKFIIAVRDPLSMVPSLHSRLLITGDETIRDFRKAWRMVPERSQGRRIPRTCIEPRWLRYDQAAAFATYLSQFFDAVGRERCHVVVFDDLKSDPWATYEGVCRFLGIEPWPATEFSAGRRNQTFRIGWVQRLFNRPPKPMQRLLATDYFLQREGKLGPSRKSKLIAPILGLRKRVMRWNQFAAPRPPLDPVTRHEIIAKYQAEVKSLERLLNRDLSQWLKADG